jgi:nucleoside-diphosphate-sugar epimerase
MVIMARILLTGATGFVGPAIARALLAAGHEVRAAGRSPPDPAIGLAGWTRIPHQDAHANWLPAMGSAEVVVHLAARAHAGSRTAAARRQIRAVNVEGTEALARQAAAAGVRRFIFLSSIKVYGEESGSQPHRATDPLRPADPYGESKAAAELILRELSVATGLEVVIIRAPLLVGPGNKANVARLVELVRSGVPLPLASIENRRSLLSLANLADLVVLSVAHPRATECPLLAADADAPSTAQLIRWVAEALQRPARLFRCPPRLLEALATPLSLGATMRRLTRSQALDAALTTELTGWTPRVTTLETLRSACSPRSEC